MKVKSDAKLHHHWQAVRLRIRRQQHYNHYVSIHRNQSDAGAVGVLDRRTAPYRRYTRVPCLTLHATRGLNTTLSICVGKWYQNCYCHVVNYDGCDSSSARLLIFSLTSCHVFSTSVRLSVLASWRDWIVFTICNLLQSHHHHHQSILIVIIIIMFVY